MNGFLWGILFIIPMVGIIFLMLYRVNAGKRLAEGLT